MGSKTPSGWPITSVPLQYGNCLSTQSYDGTKGNATWVTLSNGDQEWRDPWGSIPNVFRDSIRWSINGGDPTPSVGHGFRIRPSMFGFRLGTNTLTGTVDISGINQIPSGVETLLTATIEVTFVEGGSCD